MPLQEHVPGGGSIRGTLFLGGPFSGGHIVRTLSQGSRARTPTVGPGRVGDTPLSPPSHPPRGPGVDSSANRPTADGGIMQLLYHASRPLPEPAIDVLSLLGWFPLPKSGPRGFPRLEWEGSSELSPVASRAKSHTPGARRGGPQGVSKFPTKPLISWVKSGPSRNGILPSPGIRNQSHHRSRVPAAVEAAPVEPEPGGRGSDPAQSRVSSSQESPRTPAWEKFSTAACSSSGRKTRFSGRTLRKAADSGKW